MNNLVLNDRELRPGARFEWHSATISMHIDQPEGTDYLLDTLLAPGGHPTTVVMWLEPRNEPLPDLPALPPSNLYFGIDQKHQVAAAALLAYTADPKPWSHQWLTHGNAWRPGIPDLVMDPHIPYDTPFPHEAYIPLADLRPLINNWAWDRRLPPQGVDWRPATEREVRWHWMIG